MADEKKNEDIIKEKNEENKEATSRESKSREPRTVTKHTWVDVSSYDDDVKIAPHRERGNGGTENGEKSAVKLNSLSWDEEKARNGDPGAIYGATRVVEKTRKPYEGFITDKQVEESKEAIKIDDRSTRILSADDKAELFKMKVYPYPKSQGSAEGGKNDETASYGKSHQGSMPKSASRKHHGVTINDPAKFKRFIVIVIIAAILLACDIALLTMKAETAKLPRSTNAAKEQTTELEEENAQLTEESAEYGDYTEQKELKASWERLIENLKGTKSE